MGGQVVKNDNGAGIENRCELRFDIGVERLCPPFTEGSRAIKPLADPRTPAKAGEVKAFCVFPESGKTQKAHTFSVVVSVLHPCVARIKCKTL